MEEGKHDSENTGLKPVHSTYEKADTISIKVPPFTKKMRENPWMVTTIVLAIVLVFMVFMFYRGGLTGGTITGKTISKDDASKNLVEFLNQEAPGQFTAGDVETEYGMYKVNVNFQGREIPIYVTKDGKLAGSFQPLVLGDGNGGTGNKVDVSEDDDPFKGDANAPVTIIEFSDYECPFCGRFYSDTYLQLKKDYIDTGKVKIVFRDFPLSFHPTAMPAALAAQSVYEASERNNEVYFKYHDKLFENQQSLTDENLKKWAKELGYDISKDFDSKKFEAEVNNDLADGQAAGVSGTPAFFINGQLLEGAQPYANFKKIIDEELAKA